MVVELDFPPWPGGSNQDPLTDPGRLPDEAFVGLPPGASPWVLCRWRLKQALCVALGLIGDPKAAPLLVRVLEGRERENDLGMQAGDFYPVRKSAVRALALIGDRKCMPLLRTITAEREINTCMAAHQALAWLKAHGK